MKFIVMCERNSHRAMRRRDRLAPSELMDPNPACTLDILAEKVAADDFRYENIGCLIDIFPDLQIARIQGTIFTRSENPFFAIISAATEATAQLHSQVMTCVAPARAAIMERRPEPAPISNTRAPC